MARKHGLFRPHLGRSFPQVASTTLRDGGWYPFVNAEAAALVARFTTTPTNARKALIDNLIGSLKTGGVWSKSDCFYVEAAHSSQAARQNWIADQYNLTAVSSPTFVVDRGYTGDGSSSYLDTGFNPSTAVGNYALDSAAFGYWSRLNIQTGSASGFSDGTNAVLMNPRNGSDLTVARINSATNLTPANTDARGFFAINRSASNVTNTFKNGVPGTPGSALSTSKPNGTIRFGALTAASFNAQQFAAGFIGASLSDAEHLALYNALLTYMQAVGAA